MAAGQGFKTFTTGEVLTAGDVNGYLMQGINVFASTAARNAAITSPQEGQFAFTKDTNTTWYYDGAAWIATGTPTYSWTTYTPTNTGLTIGNGTQTARYVKIDKTVHVAYKFTMGSTSSLTGSVSIGLPSTNVSALMAAVFVFDFGGTVLVGSAFADPSQGSVTIRPNKASGTTYVSINDNLGSAFTWVTNDQFFFNLTYEEA
jgi:hypothetical protein